MPLHPVTGEEISDDEFDAYLEAFAASTQIATAPPPPPTFYGADFEARLTGMRRGADFETPFAGAGPAAAAAGPAVARPAGGAADAADDTPAAAYSHSGFFPPPARPATTTLTGCIDIADLQYDQVEQRGDFFSMPLPYYGDVDQLRLPDEIRHELCRRRDALVAIRGLMECLPDALTARASENLSRWAAHCAANRAKARREGRPLPTASVQVVPLDYLEVMQNIANTYGTQPTVLIGANDSRPDGRVMEGVMSMEAALLLHSNWSTRIPSSMMDLSQSNEVGCYLYDEGVSAHLKAGKTLAPLTAPLIAMRRSRDGRPYESLPDGELFSFTLLMLSPSALARDARPEKITAILRSLFDTAEDHGMRDLVLPALFCGSGGQHPQLIAECFKAVLLERPGVFNSISFAILPDARTHSANYEIFHRALHGLQLSAAMAATPASAAPDERDIPSAFVCSMSLDWMRDPVTVCSGKTYERAMLIALANEARPKSCKHVLCPETRAVIVDHPDKVKDLKTNTALRELILEWIKEYKPAEHPDPAISRGHRASP